MLEQFNFAFGITGPVLLLLLLGWAIRQLKLVDHQFVTQANALVFNVAMPAILFFALSSQPLTASLDWPLILVGLGGTLLFVAILLLVGRLVPEDQRGVFVQGSYRGNLAILGIALAVATYGDSVLPLIGLYIAVVTTAYNVVAIWLLNASNVGKRIVKNPILIGIVAGVIASAIELDIPELFINTGSYISALALPLALLCIGATIEFKSLLGHGRSIALAVFFKLIFSPLLFVGLGILFDLGTLQLGILYFMAASPTATASYIMARQMTQHGALAAEIVAVTTTLGVISYTFGIAMLNSFGLVV
jgi:predicted permease